jgi:rhomboid protease GluP
MMSEEHNSETNSDNQSVTPPPEFSETVTAPPAPQPPRAVRVRIPEPKTLVTYSLIGITVLLFLGQMLSIYLDHNHRDLLANWGAKSNDWIEQGQIWRLITPVFLHGGYLHIGFNMYALSILGRELERFYGHTRFLALYLVSGFTGFVVSYLFTSARSVGASTAIFGLLGAYAVFIYRNQAVFGRNSRRVLRNLGQVLVINLIIGLSPGIDNWGHLGGLIGGATIGWFGGIEYRLVGDVVSNLVLEEKFSKERFFIVSIAVVIAFSALVIFNIFFS